MKRQRPGIPTQHVLAAYRQVLSDWPVPHESHHLATRAGSTYVVSCGPEHGPALVLLHGTLSNAASWMFDAERWSEYYRVHAVDIIANRASAKARNLRWTATRMRNGWMMSSTHLAWKAQHSWACRSAASWHWTTRYEGLPGSTH